MCLSVHFISILSLLGGFWLPVRPTEVETDVMVWVAPVVVKVTGLVVVDVKVNVTVCVTVLL